MMLSRRTVFLLLALSLVLSITVPLVQGGLDGMAAILRIPFWGVLLALGMVLASWRLNAARLRLLAGSLNIHIEPAQAMGMVIATEFAGSATPVGTGAAPTMIFLLRRQGLDAGSGAAVIAVDVIADLVFFSTAIPLALTVYLIGGRVSDALVIAAMLLGLLVSGLFLLWCVTRYHRTVVLWIGRRLHYLPRLARFRYALARKIVSLRRAMAVLLRLPRRRLLRLYLYTAGHWMFRYGILPVLLWLLGESVPWSYLFLVQAALLFGAHAIFLPGGGGGVELGFAALLGPYLGPDISAVTLLAWRFCIFYWYLIAGAPVFAVQTGRAARELLAVRP
jgi:uncharacterized protein (TIRG00374 family)